METEFLSCLELTPALYKGKLSRVCVLAPPPFRFLARHASAFIHHRQCAPSFIRPFAAS